MPRKRVGAKALRHLGLPGAFVVVAVTGGPAIGRVTVEADERNPRPAEISYQFLPSS
ncbi:hypothetical protein ACFVH7_26315 [Kitasatospora indigofera]|uniref:hypothetical protein n=1 Tax=Kitasatospora indigofera TaxID=67307 RepID=UPI00363DA893